MMNIQVIGDSPAVAELIGLLRLGGYAVDSTDGLYSFRLDKLVTPLCTTCRSVNSPVDYIIVDGVDSELELRAINYIEELGVGKIVLDRSGPNKNERKLEIKLPNEYSDKVALGLYRAIDKMLNKSPVRKKRFFGLLPILLSALIPSFGYTQDQNSIIRFWNPTLDQIVAAGDVANNALRVNMVAGTISGADGAILDGVSSSIKATVFDYTNSNPLAVGVVDTDGTFLRLPSMADNSFFTAGGVRVAPVGFYVGSDAVNTGNIGAPRMSGARVAYSALAEASTGSLIGVISDAVNYNLTVSASGRGPDGSGALGYPVRIGGKDGSGNTQDILTDTAGELQVDVLSIPAVVVTSITNPVAVTGTFWQATQPISAASLPLPTGAATSALQDGIIKDGTGDTTQANVTSGRLNVDGSGVTQPVSGTVTIVLPNEGQQTAANSISVTPDTDNDAIGATGAAPPGEVIDIGGRASGADTTGLMTGITVCTEHVIVNITTATTTLIITGVANRHVRICSLNLVTLAANAVAFIAGTGATCGTSTAGMNGSTTAASGWNFAANGGISQGTGFGEIMSTKVSGGATGDSVCIVTSAATQLSGTIGYAIY